MDNGSDNDTIGNCIPSPPNLRSLESTVFK